MAESCTYRIFVRYYMGSDFSIDFTPGIVEDAKEDLQGNFTVKLNCTDDFSVVGIRCQRYNNR